MATIFSDIDESYEPANPDANISLEVEIGSGQDGAYLVFLNNKLKGANKKSSIGTGKKIQGQKSLVSVTVTDELDEFNWTSCTVKVYEGNEYVKDLGPYKKLAPNQNDTVIYSINIYFL